MTSKSERVAPTVWIVVLNWNGREWISDCLASLAELTYPTFETLLVDNGSTDGSIEFVREHFPWVHILENGENLGFAEGNNRGIHLALERGADMVLILNNDTKVHVQLLQELVKAALLDDVGVVGASLYEMDSDHLQERGMTCDLFAFPVPLGSSPESEELRECFYVSGACMLLTREFLLKGEFFDSRYFMFAEDLDVCWRTWLMGYRVVVAPKATVWHEGGGSISGGYKRSGSYETLDRRIYLRERNSLRTLMKNYGPAALSVLLILYAVALLLEWVVWLAKARPAASALVRAVLWNMLNLRDTLTFRRRIQLKRTRSDREILSRMRFTFGKWLLFKRVGVPMVEETAGLDV